jgi:hypothetical protein
VTQGTFTPAEWLYHGSTNVRCARLDGPWDARWSVTGVTSRLTMLGAPGTEVFALETYPVDNAVVTSGNPPCQTLCVRRRTDLPFLAVGDAWQDQPNLLAVSVGDTGPSLLLRTKSNNWHLRFGPGKTRFADGVSLETDGTFALLRNHDAILLVHGSQLDVESSEGTLQARLDKTASISATCTNRTVTVETAGDIQYDTRGGQDHYYPDPGVKVTFAGSLWQVKGQRSVTH